MLKSAFTLRLAWPQSPFSFLMPSWLSSEKKKNVFHLLNYKWGRCRSPKTGWQVLTHLNIPSWQVGIFFRTKQRHVLAWIQFLKRLFWGLFFFFNSWSCKKTRLGCHAIRFCVRCSRFISEIGRPLMGKLEETLVLWNGDWSTWFSRSR